MLLACLQAAPYVYNACNAFRIVWPCGSYYSLNNRCCYADKMVTIRESGSYV